MGIPDRVSSDHSARARSLPKIEHLPDDSGPGTKWCEHGSLLEHLTEPQNATCNRIFHTRVPTELDRSLKLSNLRQLKIPKAWPGNKRRKQESVLELVTEREPQNAMCNKLADDEGKLPDGGFWSDISLVRKIESLDKTGRERPAISYWLRTYVVGNGMVMRGVIDRKDPRNQK